MPTIVADPLPPGCPWSGFTPPNVDWCEEELCSWIVNPAGTWSNLAYIAFGLLMAWQVRGSRDATLALFAPASVVVGIFSFVYHASYTYLLQFFDFVGMFLFCFVVITANAMRLGWISPAKRWPFLLGGVAVFSVAVPLVSQTRFPIQGLVGLLIAVMLTQEAVAALRDPPGRRLASRGAFLAAVGLIAAAAAASAADVTRTWCDPGNHWLQGHALWHVLSAASLYALFLFYRGLAAEDAGASRAQAAEA